MVTKFLVFGVSKRQYGDKLFEFLPIIGYIMGFTEHQPQMTSACLCNHYLVANYPRIVSGLVHPSYKWDK